MDSLNSLRTYMIMLCCELINYIQVCRLVASFRNTALTNNISHMKGTVRLYVCSTTAIVSALLVYGFHSGPYAYHKALNLTVHSPFIWGSNRLLYLLFKNISREYLKRAITMLFSHSNNRKHCKVGRIVRHVTDCCSPNSEQSFV
jgi:hypothetical protein